ncbi:hypothetical protein J14TS2_10740 [Bacillus sp. J14TS2]|uniref:hypothetical protein n=1 Tax=Bacillus sp. J14TS2 TaxID=2807188 RepID=UPI001B2B40EC|nr:hypothetical protein [Bacillus sp. J14TS2]GIN70599.1 hypothetical protein J14TS2_10740 [Bacillus sp. J14TS2]
MNGVAKILIDFLEWICLFLFPITILGYPLKKYWKAILSVAVMMSFSSFLLHYTSLTIIYIVFLQIIIAFILACYFLADKMLEAFVITSMGYGFYIFVQMIFIEFLVRAFSWKYFNFLSDIFNQTLTQFITIGFLFLICFVVWCSPYQLNEFRSILKGPKMNKKYRILVLLISLLTVLFICLTVYSLLIEESDYKELSILLIMVLGFIILTFYLFLHIQFQKKQILEAKKLFLDQEQQIIDQVGYLRVEECRHFQAIAKLASRQAHEFIPDYITTNQLDKMPPEISTNSGLTSQLDELLFVFLTNKRKLGQLFGVSIKVSVSGNIHHNVSISLQQIVCISKFMDDCIFMLFRSSEEANKIIYFHVDLNEESIIFTISSPFYIKEKVHGNLKSYDAILQLKQLGASIQSEFQPIHLSIRSPIL